MNVDEQGGVMVGLLTEFISSLHNEELLTELLQTFHNSHRVQISRLASVDSEYLLSIQYQPLEVTRQSHLKQDAFICQYQTKPKYHIAIIMAD